MRKGGGRRTIRVGMTLLAYSVRRAVGALLVLLVVIWLIQFALSQITGPTTYIGRGGVVGHYVQPAAPSEWQTGALEVGVGLLILLGLAAAWRLRQRMAT